MPRPFPFPIRGFHSDNGPKFIHHRLARWLDKLRVGDFTKSRTNHTVESGDTTARHAEQRGWVSCDCD
jgi:hypothetical protein